MVGGAVSDSAAMGMHWVYDLDLIGDLQREAECGSEGVGEAGLEFMDPPRR